MGLMQIMPPSWVELGVRYGLGLDPYDPHDNMLAGAAYLKEMHDRFGSAGFRAAYHASPLRYEQHLARGRPLPPETVAYVAALTPLIASEQNGREAFAFGALLLTGTLRSLLSANVGDQVAPDTHPTHQPSDRSATLTLLPAGLFVGRSMEGQS